MSGPEIAMRTFGEEIGIAGLGFDERGSAVVRTGSGRQLGIERAERTVLVHLSQPVSHETSEWLLRAWKRAHHSQTDGSPVQTALRERDGERRLLALVRIPESEVTAPRLQQALDRLSHWLDALRHD